MRPSPTSTPREVPQSTFRTDILRALYLGMLYQVRPEAVREFWSAHPHPDLDPTVSLRDHLEALWKGSGTIPASYFFSVVNAVEPFLVAQGVGMVSFVDTTFRKVNIGGFLPARRLLSWGKSFFGLFFSDTDPRLTLLKVVGAFTNWLSQGIAHELVDTRALGRWHSGLLLVMRTNGRRRVLRYAGDVPAYDSELWASMVVQLAPLCLGLPEFERRRMLLDVRTLDFVVGGDHALLVVDGVVSIDGVVHGRVVELRDACRDFKFDPSVYGIPNRRVVLVTRDYVCPVRKRTVLHRGCCYGAPVYLYELRFAKTERPDTFMHSLIEDATSGDQKFWSEMRKRHRSLCEATRPRVVFVYDRVSEDLSCNGRHLFTSRPAKILRKMLTVYSTEGRAEFEYREFLRDPGFMLNLTAPNLGVRFMRMTETLSESCPEVRLIRTGRGKVRLDCQSLIELVEIGDTPDTHRASAEVLPVTSFVSKEADVMDAAPIVGSNPSKVQIHSAVTEM